MDDSVIRAMQLWPNVPECYGWLKLDRRGNWLLTQNEASAGLAQRTSNRRVIDFIGRNYAQQPNGSYAFQNGPQRVYVELAYAPYVVSISSTITLSLQHHTGEPVEAIQRAWIDDIGALLLETNLGIASVDDRDVNALLEKMTGAAGQSLDEAVLADKVLQTINGQAGQLWLNWNNSAVPVEPLPSREVEALGFVQAASPPS